MGREELMLDQKALYPDLYEMSIGHFFGDVWARPGLSLRDRQRVPLAANIALARPSSNYSHHSKIGASFASTSSMMGAGRVSTLRALRAPRSSTRG